MLARGVDSYVLSCFVFVLPMCVSIGVDVCPSFDLVDRVAHRMIFDLIKRTWCLSERHRRQARRADRWICRFIKRLRIYTARADRFFGDPLLIHGELSIRSPR